MREQRTDSSLSRVRIVTPCTASWEDMIGDDRERACGECKLNVYNIADMTGTEAESFLRERTGKRTCLRITYRADGTVMTDSCPRALRPLRDGALRASGLMVASAKLLIVALLGSMAPSWAQSCAVKHAKAGSAGRAFTRPLGTSVVTGLSGGVGNAGSLTRRGRTTRNDEYVKNNVAQPVAVDLTQFIRSEWPRESAEVQLSKWIGMRVIVAGRLELAGKFGPYVRLDNSKEEITIPARLIGNNNDFARVKLSGTLRYADRPKRVPEGYAAPAAHFYFDEKELSTMTPLPSESDDYKTTLPGPQTHNGSTTP